jgi:Tfp pilus assembly protein PilW
MKLFSNMQPCSRRRNISAFTLVEMMISAGVYLVIFIGVMVAIQIFALRVYSLAATKLSATAYGRKALNKIRTDIQQAQYLQVGNLGTAGSPTTFAAITNNSVAQGGALQIYSTTNVGPPYTIYYLDTTQPNNYSLIAYMVDASGGVTTNSLVSYITNTVVFDAEDFQGNVVANNMKNNQVYRMVLQLSQWEYPIAYIGGQGYNAYDYYQLRTRVCRRAVGLGN